MPYRSKCMSRCRICLCTRVFLSPLLLCKFNCIIRVSPPLLYRSTTHTRSPTCKKCEYLDVLSASPNPERLPYPRAKAIPFQCALSLKSMTYCTFYCVQVKPGHRKFGRELVNSSKIQTRIANSTSRQRKE